MTRDEVLKNLCELYVDLDAIVRDEELLVLFGQEHIEDVEEKAHAIQVACIELDRKEWIPVTERLPEEGQPVLVTRIRGREKRIEQAEKAEGDWWRVYGTRTKKVEAWMPLPEPYGGDKP